jgi:hypothetical protein
MQAKTYSGGRPFGQGIQQARLEDAALLDLLAGYKRRVAGNYRPLPSTDIEQLSAGRMWVSTKLDGELWFLVRQQGDLLLTNAKGEVIAGDVPVLAQAQHLAEGTVIAGELHARVDGRRARVGDLAFAMGRDDGGGADAVLFSAFDLLRDHSGEPETAYEQRLASLSQIIPGGSHLSVVATELLHTAADVRSRFDTRVLSGEQEGLIVRLDNGIIHKLKPSVSIDAAVIGFTTKVDQPDLVRSILLGLLREDGAMVLLGACGNLGSAQERQALRLQLAPLTLASQVRHASDSGGLYTFVRPELVAEVVVTDLQGELSDGREPTSPVLTLAPEGWQSAGMAASPRLLHPVLSRLRTDKAVNVQDVRFAQVQAYLAATAQAAPAAELPQSTLLRRAVWTKEAKGQTAVRKLLVWKTNKEAVADFPAYVVHWSDFSAGRATPLDREVKPAPDEARAMQIADEMIAANIKKGWNPV